MDVLVLVLLIAAAICFFIDAFGVAVARVALIGLGLGLFTVAYILQTAL